MCFETPVLLLFLNFPLSDDDGGPSIQCYSDRIRPS